MERMHNTKKNVFFFFKFLCFCNFLFFKNINKNKHEINKKNKNMNCGTYTECKTKMWVFGNVGFLKFSKRVFGILELLKCWVFVFFCSEVFWLVWCFCKGSRNF